MKFELPFNEKIFKDQMMLNLNTVWKDYLNQNKKNMLWTIPMI